VKHFFSKFVVTKSVITKPVATFMGLPLGFPQLVAAILLVFFLGQGILHSARTPLSMVERSFLAQGQEQLAGGAPMQNSLHSPLAALLGGMMPGQQDPEALLGPERRTQEAPGTRLLARFPFLLTGLMLGASLWYVSRRLFGNAGGYTALALYGFTPALIAYSDSVQPGIFATWGAFGVVFTSLAVAHTLYAPREVVLWNWRRILLLGLSVAFAVGSHFALVMLLPLAAALLLYLAPERRGAAVVILVAGCAVAVTVLWMVYSFRFTELAVGLGHISLRGFTPGALISSLSYTLLVLFLLRAPGFLVLLIAAIGTFIAWPRTRFFGTAAPFLVFVFLLALAVVFPHQAGFTFFVVSLPFAFVFVAGVFADLLDSPVAPLAMGVLIAGLACHAMFALVNRW
jgi:hypothetical protein